MSGLVWISFSFFHRVAESEFRTQPAATAVSATGRCRHHTHPDARKRAVFLVHAPQRIIRTFPVGTPHWLKVKRSLCYVFVCTQFHLA